MNPAPNSQHIYSIFDRGAVSPPSNLANAPILNSGVLNPGVVAANPAAQQAIAGVVPPHLRGAGNVIHVHNPGRDRRRRDARQRGSERARRRAVATGLPAAAGPTVHNHYHAPVSFAEDARSSSSEDSVSDESSTESDSYHRRSPRRSRSRSRSRHRISLRRAGSQSRGRSRSRGRRSLSRGETRDIIRSLSKSKSHLTLEVDSDSSSSSSSSSTEPEIVVNNSSNNDNGGGCDKGTSNHVCININPNGITTSNNEDIGAGTGLSDSNVIESGNTKVIVNDDPNKVIIVNNPVESKDDIPIFSGDTAFGASGDASPMDLAGNDSKPEDETRAKYLRIAGRFEFLFVIIALLLLVAHVGINGDNDNLAWGSCICLFSSIICRAFHSLN